MTTTPTPNSMQAVTATARGIIPESKEVTFTCPRHGTHTYRTFRQHDGSWLEAYCPVCRKEAKAEQDLIDDLKADAVNRISRLTRALNAPQELDSRLTFENFICETPQEERSLMICRRFAENFLNREIQRAKAKQADLTGWSEINSKGMLFTGEYGTGKTHLACAILNTLRACGVPGFYITVPDLFDRLTDRVRVVDAPDVLTKLENAPTLVLDELGVQSGSEYERKRLYQIIDGRIKRGRPTILITNLDSSELELLMTERVMSRIKAACYVVNFLGRCRRESLAKQGAAPEEVF